MFYFFSLVLSTWVFVTIYICICLQYFTTHNSFLMKAMTSADNLKML